MQFCELPLPPRPSPARAQGREQMRGGMFGFRNGIPAFMPPQECRRERPFRFETTFSLRFKLRFQTAFQVSGRFEAV
ncbi:hypothetical protein CGZ77_03800 [Neisseria sp. KEM232]|nr:hypothetical protein CGZ77_03800 [Neisseria sp. KEM232]